MAATKKKPVAPVIDIDAADQQFRAENDVPDRPAPTVRFRGEDYKLVSEIPVDVMIALADTDEVDEAASAKLIVKTTRSLFDDGEWDRFVAAKPTLQNLMQVFDLAFKAYGGMTLGESEASEESSRTTGTPPRQPSKRGTASS
jgi:hypothetical protein